MRKLVAVMGLTAVLAVLLLVGIPTLARSQNPAVQAEWAKQEAVKSWQAAQEAQAAIAERQAAAQNAIALDGAARAALLVVGLGVGAAVVILAVGGALALVDGMRLKSRLIQPVPHMAAAVYPAVMTAAGIVDGLQPKLATRQAPTLPAPALAAPAQPAELAAAGLPAAVDVRAWQPGAVASIPIGVSAGGALSVALDGGWSLGLVAGLPGSGKSTLLRAIVWALARQAVQVLLVDSKGTEFAACEAAPWLFGPIARRPTETAQAYAKLQAELTRRYDVMRQAGADCYHEAGLAPIVAIVDELAIVASQDGETIGAITDIARLGRAAGVYQICATQRPAAQSITSELRALAEWAVCFAVERRGEALVAGCPGAERLERIPGRGLFRRADTVLFQAYHTPNWRQDMQPVAAVARTQQPVATIQPAPSQPVAAYAKPGTPLPPERIAAIRQAYANGASLNSLTLATFGYKDGRTAAAIRAVLAES